MTPRIPLPKTELEFRNASVRIDRIEIETVAKVAYFEANGTNEKGWTRLIPENHKK